MTRADHCIRPDQHWCDCDWCRYLGAGIIPYVLDVIWATPEFDPNRPFSDPRS